MDAQTAELLHLYRLMTPEQKNNFMAMVRRIMRHEKRVYKQVRA